MLLESEIMCNKNYFKCIVLLFDLCLLLCQSGCVYHQSFGEFTNDVTDKQKYWGGYEKDQVYELLKDVFLQREQDWWGKEDYSTKYVLATPEIINYYESPASIKEYNENPKKYSGVVGIVTAGTKIRCTKLLHQGDLLWGSIIVYYAEILQGPFKGYLVEIDDISEVASYKGPKILKPEPRFLRKILTRKGDRVNFGNRIEVETDYGRSYQNL